MEQGRPSIFVLSSSISVTCLLNNADHNLRKRQDTEIIYEVLYHKLHQDPSILCDKILEGAR